MTQKMCVKCGVRPRKVSRSGKELTKCDECQRAYWRERKQKENGYQPRNKGNWSTIKPNTDGATRKCKQCKKRKPLEAFARWGSKSRKTTCKACEGERKVKVEHTNIQPAKPNRRRRKKKDTKHVVLVVGDHLVLAEVISQAEVKNKSLLIDIYREQGYQIETVYESEELS